MWKTSKYTILSEKEDCKVIYLTYPNRIKCLHV